MLPVAPQAPAGVGSGVAGGVATGVAVAVGEAEGDAVGVADAVGEGLAEGEVVDVELGSAVSRARLAPGDAPATGRSAVTTA
jgi:hypothetical protein